MIKIIKTAEPSILQTHKASWTSDLMNYITSNAKIPDVVKNRYNQPEIKSALESETHNKCMYCESKISDVTYAHIEHYKPKSKYPQETFEWNNLGLACPICNTNKNDIFDETCPIVNPYKDNPNDHFISLGTMICHKDKRGEITEKLLELNRPHLMESRMERINAVRLLIDKYNEETNTSLKFILKKEIVRESADDKPYAMAIKAVIKQLTDIEI